MSDQPLVSVIVPSYCHEAFILDCIQSIHAQTYKNIELVIVDDCSSDQTFALAGTLLATSVGNRFKNVVLQCNTENIGAYATINKGIQASRGQYVAIINSDDMFAPSRIETMLAAMQEQKSAFAFSLVEVFGGVQPDGSIGVPSHDFLAFQLRQKLDVLQEVTIGFSLLRKNVAVSTGNFLFSRSLYDKVGPFLPLKYCHDWDFILQTLFYTEPVVVLQPLYRYRLHGQNSFQGLAYLAQVESEVVLRRFFRRGLTGVSLNPKFPSAQNWPGFFDAFVERSGMNRFLEREKGEGLKGWRIYETQRAGS